MFILPIIQGTAASSSAPVKPLKRISTLFKASNVDEIETVRRLKSQSKPIGAPTHRRRLIMCGGKKSAPPPPPPPPPAPVKDNSAELNMLRSQLDDEKEKREESEAKVRKEMEQMKATHQKEIQRVQMNFRRQMFQMKKAHEKVVKDLKNLLAEAKKENQMLRAELQKYAEQRRRDAEAFRSMKRDLMKFQTAEFQKGLNDKQKALLNKMSENLDRQASNYAAAEENIISEAESGKYAASYAADEVSTTLNVTIPLYENVENDLEELDKFGDEFVAAEYEAENEESSIVDKVKELLEGPTKEEQLEEIVKKSLRGKQ